MCYDVLSVVLKPLSYNYSLSVDTENEKLSVKNLLSSLNLRMGEVECLKYMNFVSKISTEMKRNFETHSDLSVEIMDPKIHSKLS